MNFFSMVLIIVIILALGGIFYIQAFNKLNDLKTKLEEAENIIDENLRLKYDALIRLSNSLKKLMKDNKNYFKEYEKLKDMNISNFDMDRKLNEGLTLILKVQEDLNLEDDEDMSLTRLLQDIIRN